MVTLLMAISAFNLTGFWHSIPYLSEGYQSCYFFWETGEYAFTESNEHGYVYTGDWSLEGEKLALDLLDAITVEGQAVNIRLAEIKLDIRTTGFLSQRIISLDGEYFFLLERDPQTAILSLVPTWGMTDSERSAINNAEEK